MQLKKGVYLKNMVVKSNVIIKDAIKRMNKNKKGIIFICDTKNKLAGVLTDGDIRRAFASGISSESNVSKIMNDNPIFLYENTDRNIVYKKLGKNYRSGEVYYIPIVNENRKIIGYYSYLDVKYIPIAKPFLQKQEVEYVLDCLNDGWISSKGKYINKFENAFAEYIGCKYAVAVMNGTAALHLALESLGIGKNDEVIIPSLTFIATANAVTYTGAKPVFADSEKDTWNIDPLSVERLITPRTKAIIPVHLYGQPCRMEELQEIASKNKLYIIEDAAEAHGAKYKGIHVGSIGDVGCFSFFGNKIITTGEGGMLVTNNEKIFEKAKILRDHGMDPNKRYWHPYIGYNYRMTNLQAAIGLAQMEKINMIIDRKISIAKLYRKKLENYKNFSISPHNNWSTNVYWMFSILINDNGILDDIQRDNFMDFMQKQKIETRPFFYPIHQMPPYFSNLSLPVCEKISSNGINLPSYTEISDKEICRICDKIDAYINMHKQTI